MGYTHGIRWTEEKAKNEIKDVMKALNLNRMPSRSEIEKVMQTSTLTNYISKNGGFKFWADKLSLNMKKSETSLGKEYEQYITDLLNRKGYEVERMSTKHPYDLLVNMNIKIDVKVSNLYRGPKGEFHTFNLEKYNHNCDLFICVCVTDDKVVKILVIPSKFLMKVSQLSLGINSIYDVFKNRFDYIEKYDVFYSNLKTQF